MGLDLVNSVSDDGFRVGSYSGVHHRRRQMVVAAVAYLESILGNNNEEDNLADSESEENFEKRTHREACLNTLPLLKSWIAPEKDFFDICYGKVVFEEALVDSGLAGLYWWVQHSDCEGVLTAGQALDVASSISLLLPHIDASGEFSKQAYFIDLMRFMKKAADAGAIVRFC